MVSVPDKLIEQMTNDVGDRHVTATAVVAQAQVIVTFNLDHFKPKDLELRIASIRLRFFTLSSNNRRTI